MIYPILHFEDPNTPYILIYDTIYDESHRIYLDPKYNPFDILYDLISDFLAIYEDGYDEGLVDGLNERDYDND